MFSVIADRQAVQLFKDFGAQGAQNMLSGPGHREESRAGENGAHHIQRDDQQDHARETGRALLCGNTAIRFGSR